MDTEQAEGVVPSVEEALKQLEQALAEAAQTGDGLERLAMLRKIASFGASKKANEVL